MTREEILKMEAGNEIDALVEVYVLGDDGTNATNKHYSTDISAAWEVANAVVSKLSMMGKMGGERRASFGLYITQTQALMFDSKHYQAFFKMPKWKGVCNVDKSAPLSICRAALLAMEKAK